MNQPLNPKELLIFAAILVAGIVGVIWILAWASIRIFG